MNKYAKRLGLGMTLVAGLVASSPVFANAQAFSTSTAPSTVNSAILDVSLIIGGVIATILGLWAALTGLGWGMRKFRQHVTGRKF